MAFRFDVAAGVAHEAASARALASARREAWREPLRMLDATHDLFTQAAVPLHRANDLESTSFAGNRYLRPRRTAEWSQQVGEGVALLRSAEHGAASFNEARRAAVEASTRLPDTVLTIEAPGELVTRPLDMEFARFATSVAERVAHAPKTRIYASDMETVLGEVWRADHGAADARRIAGEIEDLTSLPPLESAADRFVARAQQRVVDFGSTDATQPRSTPNPPDGLSYRQRAILDATPLAAHVMARGAAMSGAWSEATLRDVVASADAAIEAARGLKASPWASDAARDVEKQVRHARDVIGSVSLVPGAADSLGSDLVELERSARHRTMSAEQLDRIAAALDELKPVAVERTRSRIAELTSNLSVPSLSAADEARIRFEATLEQTASRALGT